MPKLDPRLIPGSKVHCKASAVFCKAECKRLYGGLHDSHFMEGTVLSAKKVSTHSSSGKIFAKNVVEVEVNLLGNRTKIVTLGLAQLKAGPALDGNLLTNHPVINPSDPVSPLAVAELPPPPPHQQTPETPTQRASASFCGNSVSSGNSILSENLPSSPNLLAPDPTVTCHGVDWFTDNEKAKDPANGKVYARKWFVRDRFGNQYYEDSDLSNSLDIFGYFEMMFPPDALDTILCETNNQLRNAGYVTTYKGELLRFFGVMITITRLTFDSRRDLWSTIPAGKFVPRAVLGRTGISKNRFDALFSCLRWSHQPSERPPDMSAEEYRWLLVDDLVAHINRYRQRTFFPSERICVDESISRWYGIGGDWINEGLPHYIAIDRKPENGCEIQNAACGESGVMMSLSIVKSNRVEESDHDSNEEGNSTPHGVCVLQKLLTPWKSAHDRVVCADSYFASVAAARAMRKLGFRFIGVVKTAHRGFPLKYLSSVPLAERGSVAALVTEEDGLEMTAFVWCDRERRYFISTADGISEGKPYQRKRWRQVEPVESNAPPVVVDLQIAQPRGAEVYYRKTRPQGNPNPILSLWNVTRFNF